MSDEDKTVQPDPTDLVNGEPIADPETRTEPEKKDEGPDPVEVLQRSTWARLGLDPEDFDKHSPDDRDVLMGDKFQAARLGQAPAKESESVTEPDNTQKSDAPELPTVPTIDGPALASSMATALAEGDNETVIAGFAQMFKVLDASEKRQAAMADVMMDALKHQDGVLVDVTGQVQSLIRPTQLKAALAKVPLATPADIPVADKLLADGLATTDAHALLLAAAQRIQTAGPADPKKVAEDLVRKRSALAADRLSTSSDGGDAVPQHISTRGSLANMPDEVLDDLQKDVK